MVQAPAQTLTLEEFLQQPDTEPASEYIDGQIIQKPIPQGEHSAIQTELAPAINAIVKPSKTARAFTQLRCTFGGTQSIIPDISVFQWQRIPRQDNGRIANAFSLAPDWSIEILSPNQSQTKVLKNLLHCLNHGTQMGWLIDPTDLSVFVYRPNQSTSCHDESEETLPVPKFARDFKLTGSKLFSWLLD